MIGELILRKTGYYASSLLVIVLSLKNPWNLLPIFFKKEARLNFRNGMSLYASQPLDVLVMKETIFDDVYGVSTLRQTDELEPAYIIDVGAAMGDFAIFASRTFPNAKIVAFDPNPQLFKLLEKNIRANQMKNIMTRPLPLGNKPVYTIYVGASNVRSSTIKDDLTRKIIKLKPEPLEKYLTRNVDLLKIDTEGGEVDILKSVKSWQKIRRVVCEYHRHLVKDQDLLIIKILSNHFKDVRKNPDQYNKDIGYIIAC